MDMKDVPKAFENIDLLWSEGAAYNIGFPNALETWRPAIAPHGFLVVSEMSRLKQNAPEPVRAFFLSKANL
jgi:serine/threonine-protein kinase HipA